MNENCSCNPIRNARCEAGRKIAYARTIGWRMVYGTPVALHTSYADYCKEHPLPCKIYSYD
jgi:hypothetical protein